MVKNDGEAVTGDNILQYIEDQIGSGWSEADREKIRRFDKMLSEVNMGIVTYGLAFHHDRTSVLRYPFSDGKFFEKVLKDFHHKVGAVICLLFSPETIF